jgi:hypothetical protein
MWMECSASSSAASAVTSTAWKGQKNHWDTTFMLEAKFAQHPTSGEKESKLLLPLGAEGNRMLRESLMGHTQQSAIQGADITTRQYGMFVSVIVPHFSPLAVALRKPTTAASTPGTAHWATITILRF